MANDQDVGIWDMQAGDCEHPESRTFATCNLCPKCDTITPFVSDWSLVRADLERELSTVEDFGAGESEYVNFLNRSIKYFS